MSVVQLYECLQAFLDFKTKFKVNVTLFINICQSLNFDSSAIHVMYLTLDFINNDNNLDNDSSTCKLKLFLKACDLLALFSVCNDCECIYERFSY